MSLLYQVCRIGTSLASRLLADAICLNSCEFRGKTLVYAKRVLKKARIHANCFPFTSATSVKLRRDQDIRNNGIGKLRLVRLY